MKAEKGTAQTMVICKTGRIGWSILVLVFNILIHEAVGVRFLSLQEEDLELERQLKLLNKPAILTFSMKNGDTVDCVDMYKQPAFDNPLLKDHKIQVNLNQTGYFIRHKGLESNKTSTRVGMETVDCPDGTVPIRRVSKEELQNQMALPNIGDLHLQDGDHSSGYFVAFRANDIGAYKGGGAELSIYEISNIKLHQNSGAFVMLMDNKPLGAGDAIIAGWHVSTDLYGDTRPRLTISFMSGGNGCYNLLCSGFVQTSKTHYIGSAFSEVSQVGGKVLTVLVELCMAQIGNGWLLTISNDNGYDQLGYWPVELFSNFPSNTVARFVTGGSVYTPHGVESPGMGSGEFPGTGYRHAAFAERMYSVEKDFTEKRQEKDLFKFYISPESRCYGVGDVRYDRDDMKIHFYFGGPGGCLP